MSDLIDRQAALDKLNELKKVELVNAGNKPSKSYWALQAALMVVSGLPSAQPEPEHTMDEFMYGQDLGSSEDGSL